MVRLNKTVIDTTIGQVVALNTLPDSEEEGTSGARSWRPWATSSRGLMD